jgi:hypothetical protein
MRRTRTRQTTAILAVLVLAPLVMAAAGSNLAEFFGTWEGEDGPRRGYTFRMSETLVDIGPGVCRNLPYKVIEIFPAIHGALSVAIEVDAPPGKCRSSQDDQVIIRLWRVPNSEYLGYSRCPTLEDLKLQAEGSNRRCSGGPGLKRKIAPKVTANKSLERTREG